MEKTVNIIGAGLAGSEAALQLAARGIGVRLVEMRPKVGTDVHKSGLCAELVCSNSLKSTKPESAAGMLKQELDELDSFLYGCALENRVAAGGALAVDRDLFAQHVTNLIDESPNIERINAQALCVNHDGSIIVDAATQVGTALVPAGDALIIASGPLTSAALSENLEQILGCCNLAFFDAAAPVVMADSLDMSKLFRQSRYEDDSVGDYLNAPFNKQEYQDFIEALVSADRVIRRDFETKDLFQACQPIEEIARKGADAPRFGALKPVGLTDPATGHRPWAALQLRAEDAHRQSYNLVGFQTNLTFSEQKRVFRMIPGLQEAEFARFGVMHRNTFVEAPALLDGSLLLKGDAAEKFNVPILIAGQLAGTEGYCEAIRSGLHAAITATALLQGKTAPPLPVETAFGALMSYASDAATEGYQPMHVNFGIMVPLPQKIRNKQQRYQAYAQRGVEALNRYKDELALAGLLMQDAQR